MDLRRAHGPWGAGALQCARQKLDANDLVVQSCNCRAGLRKFSASVLVRPAYLFREDCVSKRRSRMLISASGPATAPANDGQLGYNFGPCLRNSPFHIARTLGIDPPFAPRQRHAVDQGAVDRGQLRQSLLLLGCSALQVDVLTQLAGARCIAMLSGLAFRHIPALRAEPANFRKRKSSCCLRVVLYQRSADNEDGWACDRKGKAEQEEMGKDNGNRSTARDR